MTRGPFSKLIPHLKPCGWGIRQNPSEKLMCVTYGDPVPSALMATWKIHKAKAGPAGFPVKEQGWARQPPVFSRARVCESLHQVMQVWGIT